MSLIKSIAIVLKKDARTWYDQCRSCLWRIGDGIILILIMSVWKRAVELNDPSKYEETVKTLREKYKRVFVLFTGEKDDKGVSWCPDCTKAEPALEKAFSIDDKNTVLLICNVKRSEYKGVTDFIYRRDKNIRLTTVPTIGKISPSMHVEMKLEEDQILNEELLNEIFE